MLNVRRNVCLLACILILSGVGKFLLFFTVYHENPDKIFSPDSLSYVNPARAILETGRFAVSPENPEIPEVIRTPGYPIFLAGIFSLFGETYIPLIIIQILLSLGTIFMTYRIAYLLWNPNIALISSGFQALDPLSLISSQRILTETLFTFVLSMAVLLLIYALKKQQHLMLLFFFHGMCLATATLIRPITYYFIVPATGILALILKVSLKFSWRRLLVIIMVLLSSQIILVVGWQIRNYRVTGKAEFSYIQGVNLLFYSGSGVIAERDRISFKEARYRLGYNRYSELHPETQGWSIAQLDQRWKQKGWDIIRRNPFLFLKTHLRGIGKMIFGPGESRLINYVGNEHMEVGPLGELFILPLKDYIQKWVIKRPHFLFLSFLATCYLLLVYVSMSYSLWLLLQAEDTLWSIHLFIAVLLVYFIVVSGGPAAYSRFRLPLMPCFCLYAGFGFYHGWSDLRERLFSYKDK